MAAIHRHVRTRVIPYRSRIKPPFELVHMLRISKCLNNHKSQCYWVNRWVWTGILSYSDSIIAGYKSPLLFRTDKLEIIMNKNSAGGWAGIWSLSVKTGALKVVEGSMPDYGSKDWPPFKCCVKPWASPRSMPSMVRNTAKLKLWKSFAIAGPRLFCWVVLLSPCHHSLVNFKGW